MPMNLRSLHVDRIAKIRRHPVRYDATWLSLVWMEVCRQPKIHKHDVSILCKQDVLRFEVSIDDTSSVKTFHTLHYFGSVETCSVASESSPFAELCSKVSSWVKVQCEVKIVLVMK